VSQSECWNVGILECSAPPFVGEVGRDIRIFTTMSQTSLEFRIDIRSSSFSEIISYGKSIESGMINFEVKYPSIISKSDSINSIIPFRHSTRKSPDSCRADFSWRFLINWILFLVSILTDTCE
jgi:hypothetical protein